MGIYREIKVTDAEGRPTTLEYAQGREVTIHVFEPGLEYTATLKPEDWTETRTDCFCCSCGEREGSDPACRNHGFAASRPCEVHGTPGATWDGEMSPDLADVVPESVQQVRRREEGWVPISSSNPEVAKISDGNVIAVGPGTTTIVSRRNEEELVSVATIS